MQHVLPTSSVSSDVSSQIMAVVLPVTRIVGTGPRQQAKQQEHKPVAQLVRAFRN